MNELSASFAPDWVLPPGESILDIAEERGWTQAELAQRLGYSEKHMSQLINGKVSAHRRCCTAPRACSGQHHGLLVSTRSELPRNIRPVWKPPERPMQAGCHGWKNCHSRN